jgi:hypothetical protein
VDVDGGDPPPAKFLRRQAPRPARSWEPSGTKPARTLWCGGAS